MIRHAFPHSLVWPAPMDDFPDGDLEEFFEPLDSIPSSASSDCGAEDPCFPSSKFQAPVLTAQSLSFSKYEVWTDRSCSVFERRQRLFMQMGLKLGQQNCDNAAALVDTFPSNAKAADAPHGSSSPQERSGLADPVRGFQDPSSQDRISDLATCTVDTSNGLDAQVSLTNSATSQAVQAGNAVEQHHPKLPQRGDGMIFDENHSSRRSTEANALEHSIVDKSQSTDREFAKHKLRGISALDVKLPNRSPPEKDVQISHRSRDLDSGKETVVINEAGKDGAFNIFKDLGISKGKTDAEFKTAPALSPVVQEVMKRGEEKGIAHIMNDTDISNGSEKKRRTWFHAVMGLVRGYREKGHHKSGSDEKTSSLESSARRQSHDCKDKDKTGRRVKVHAHKKSTKDFTDLYLQQQIQAHDGVIWVMKFSLDGRFLASAGSDKVVKLWEVYQNGNWLPDDSRESRINHASKQLGALDSHFGDSHHPFLFPESAKCFLSGHTEDILDLSWSPSQLLLSSSMDKTVRLWNVHTEQCVRIFNHNDYVTCVHFNPLDDDYFISGSLDGKVRIWSTKEPYQVVDWVDLNEMVTAACYMPDAQGAVVGSHNGICRFYKKSADGKLQLDMALKAHREKKRSQGKMITGIQFMPGSTNKVMITSHDSRIRVYDGGIVRSKYKGLRNTSSPISASFSSDGTYIICASEDSRVCIWKYYDGNVEHLNGSTKTLSGSFEDFTVRDVSVAILMPRISLKLTQVEKNVDEIKTNVQKFGTMDGNDSCIHLDKASDGVVSDACLLGFKVKMTDANAGHDSKETFNISELQNNGQYCLLTQRNSPVNPILNRFLEDCTKPTKDMPDDETRGEGFISLGTESTTWPDESLTGVQQVLSRPELECVLERHEKNSITVPATHGFVIVTAGSKGLIQVFQNRCLTS